MASVTLVTMSHNFLAKIWYSSLVMRQVSGRRPEGIRARPEANTLLGSAALRLENQQSFPRRRVPARVSRSGWRGRRPSYLWETRLESKRSRLWVHAGLRESEWL
jgi:hypothetical protein